MRRLVAVALLSMASSVWPQDAPVVRAEVTPGEINVGESAQLRITVLVPTWFPQPPVFPSFELSNAITRLPPDSSFPTSERVGRDTWSGIVRNYRVYPMLGATYRMAGDTIRVTYADPGSDAIVVDVPIPEIEFRGVVPAGAEGLDPYIAGTDFRLDRTIDGNVDALTAGDAIIVRYTAALEGLPAIFIPPLAPAAELPGVSIYADEPVVEDGDPAMRTEAVTLVFEAGGEFALPGREISWWNADSRQVETASVAPLSLSVTGPALTTGGDEPEPGTHWRTIATFVLLGGLLTALIKLLWPSVARRRAEAKARYEQSEQYAYRQLQNVFNRGGAVEAHQAMLEWVQRIAPGYDLRDFASDFGDAEFASALSAFIESIYGDSGSAAEVSSIRSGLAAARHACLRQDATRPTPALPPLNP